MTRNLALDESGRGLQFFGAADGSLAGRRFQINGERAAALGFERLALLVRPIANDEWTPGVLSSNRENERWVHEQAVLHEAVLDRAMSRGPVVPARFLSVFACYTDLEAYVRTNYDRWRRSLARISGKEEWTLHVFAGPHVPPEHAPYLLRIRPARSRTVARTRDEPGGVVEETLAKTWRACTAGASASRRLDSPHDKRAIFGATLLVPSGRVDALKSSIEGHALAARQLGLTYYLERPRPPFNFV